MTFKEKQKQESQNRHSAMTSIGEHWHKGIIARQNFELGSTWAARYILEHEAVRKMVNTLEGYSLEYGGAVAKKALAAFKELERQVNETNTLQT